MTRRALADVKLPTGDILPEGARIATSTSLHHDASHYDDPMVFKGHRFIEWRGTDRENASNLVSTGLASLGFGHGKHACPGRFFASNEIKVALCHLLMKYDWELPTDQNIEAHVIGFTQGANTQAKVNVRMRVDTELNIDSVE
jgi:cytochrome P450